MLYSYDTPWCDYWSLSQLCGCPVLICDSLHWYFGALYRLWDRKKHMADRANISPANSACRLVAICCPQRNKKPEPKTPNPLLPAKQSISNPSSLYIS